MESTPDNKEGWDPTLVFGTASFLNDTGSDMIAPIWPTFLSDRLHLNLLQIGIVDGMALTVTSLAKLVAGYLSDRLRKRKSFITSGYLMSVAARIGFVLSVGFFHILFWKTMDRLGKMRGPPRDAIVAAHAEQTRRGRAFGVLRAMDTGGALLGALITYLLFVWLGYTGIILLAAVPGACAVVVVAALVKEEAGREVFKGVSFRGLSRDLKILLAASVVFALGTFTYSFVLLFGRQFGISDPNVPLLYILFTGVYAASAYPFGRASDTVGRRPVLTTAFVLLMLTALWAHFIVDWVGVCIMLVLFGLFNGALDPVQTSFVADLVEEERRASVIGAFQMAVGFAALPAGTIMGWLWMSVAPLVAFQFSFVMCVIATVLLMAVGVRPPAQSTSDAAPEQRPPDTTDITV